MRKWTQQQRANAIRDTEEMCMASDRPTAVASYNDVAIELACQRNELLEALKGVLSAVEICEHSSTHRGGAIWTICDDCDTKWADDEGGMPPYKDPASIAKARAAIAKAEGK